MVTRSVLDGDVTVSEQERSFDVRDDHQQGKYTVELIVGKKIML